MIDVRRLAIVLKHANAQPPFATDTRAEFYRLKEAILRTYGERIGEDVQHIVKRCWNCRDGWIYEYGDTFPSDPCHKCDGKGIYSERFVLLERWQIAGQVFHKPLGVTERRDVTIEGLIQHRRVKLAFAAQRVLAMVCNPAYYLYLDAFGMAQADLRKFKAVLAYLLGFPRDRWQTETLRWQDVQGAKVELATVPF